MTAVLRWLYCLCHRRGWLCVAATLLPGCTILYSIDARHVEPGADATWLTDDSGQVVRDDAGKPVLAPDAGALVVDADPGAPDAEPSCSIETQADCPPVHACYPVDFDTPEGVCRPLGHGDQNAACSVHEQCSAGFLCWQSQCREICEDVSECDIGGHTCTSLGDAFKACLAII
jgi:hypothetical protein